ncbi:uncharacterized protein LOC103508960 [Diaphorina citri]|uniref:Uncharacterized protein LOC103508960 n=1 Tax=Diaphorina citri TaxID=121845 RepID=A0A1S3D0U3_DIACI|nr:uncharacterized protein LOC103508960 [Diaphorina citri]
MPLCESLSEEKLWSGTGGSRSQSPYCETNGSTSSSPTSTSPPLSHCSSNHRIFKRGSSTFILESRSPSPTPPPQPPRLLTFIIGWYPAFLLVFIKNALVNIFYLSWTQLIFIGPAIWVSAWLWVFIKCFTIPMMMTKWLFSIVFTPASERLRKKRTVLISGGSTIQALHLARNFYTAGARVIVFELEGKFSLTRFSTAVHRFYTVPEPKGGQGVEYIEAVKKIVEREEVMYYIPVSETSPAYYDALLKPILSSLGCTCFCPNLQEVRLLDDSFEFHNICKRENIETPNFYRVQSKEDISELYESGVLRSGRNLMCNVGDIKHRIKLIMPHTRRQLKLPRAINESHPWLIIQDSPGDHYVTCTTVKESKVEANVTCRVEHNGIGFVPVESDVINQWLNHFFARLTGLRPIYGHLSFRFVITRTGTLLPLSCKVGISLPYICYTNVHPRIVWKPCRHFSRQKSGPLVVTENGKPWITDLFGSFMSSPNISSIAKLFGQVLDKREVLFVYWDPVPYCAYYHLQLPFNNISRLLRGEEIRNRHSLYHRRLTSSLSSVCNQ